MLKIFRVPEALGENQKKFFKIGFFYKQTLNLLFKVHCTIEIQDFWNVEFYYYNIHKNCRPLASKLRDPKLSKLAFQVVFSAQNVPLFSFWFLLAPKLKNKGGP